MNRCDCGLVTSEDECSYECPQRKETSMTPLDPHSAEIVRAFARYEEMMKRDAEREAAKKRP